MLGVVPSRNDDAFGILSGEAEKQSDKTIQRKIRLNGYVANGIILFQPSA